MSKILSTTGQAALLANSIRNIKTTNEYKRILEEMPNKTDLEINALKGLNRSFICKFIVAIIAVIGISLGTYLFCMGVMGGFEKTEYTTETSLVKNGYIKYGRYDTKYYVGDLGYEEGTWLYVYIDKDTGRVAMLKAKEEIYQQQNSTMTQGGIIVGISIAFLILGLIIALGVFERPFRKWHKIYTQTHPSLL